LKILFDFFVSFPVVNIPLLLSVAIWFLFPFLYSLVRFLMIFATLSLLLFLCFVLFRSFAVDYCWLTFAFFTINTHRTRFFVLSTSVIHT